MKEPFRLDSTEASRAGFPAIGFAFELATTRMHASPFPMPGWMAAAHGPPGGPQAVMVTAAADPGEEKARERLILERFASYRGTHLHGWSRVTFAGAGRDALALETGASHAHTNWCAVFIPDPRGLLVVALGLGGRSATCTEILAFPPFSTIATSFTIE